MTTISIKYTKTKQNKNLAKGQWGSPFSTLAQDTGFNPSTYKATETSAGDMMTSTENRQAKHSHGKLNK